MILGMENDSPFVERSFSGKQWVERPQKLMDAITIAQQGTPEFIARLLAARNISHSDAPTFLNPTLKNCMPDPSHLKDMDKAVSYVVDLVEKSSKIGIFGDYDVDGATSSSLLFKFFESIGIACCVHIPDRIDEGYGPNIEAFRSLRDQGCSVIITVDCGTTAFCVLEQAHAEDIPVIVLDHHASEMQLPPTIALVNPNRFDEESPLSYVAAVGLSYLFVIALNRTLRERGFFESREAPDLLQFLDLVALGTVCDVVPLVGLNRAYVRQGLKILHQRQNLGLKILSDVASINQKVSAYHLGFVLGPRINAGGRVGTADLGMRLLTTRDSIEALSISRTLDTLNRERQEIELEALHEASVQASSSQDEILIVHGNWHPGIIGIVAGRLKERYHKPTLVISFNDSNVGKGSGRSIEGVDLGSLMHAAKDAGLLLNGGGHAMAAGFTIEHHRCDAFKAFICEALQKFSFSRTQTLRFDGFLSPDALTLEFMESLEQLAPYGQSNPTPLFVINDVHLKKVTALPQGHISCLFSDFKGKTIKGFSFKAMDSDLGAALLAQAGSRITLIGSPKVNSWNGRDTVEFMIQDATPTEVNAIQMLHSAGK
jgi:single-stranded-DNA-specific exonuclease